MVIWYCFFGYVGCEFDWFVYYDVDGVGGYFLLGYVLLVVFCCNGSVVCVGCGGVFVEGMFVVV